MRRSARQGLVAAATTVLLATGGLVGLNATGVDPRAAAGTATAGDGELPGALGGHLEKLRRAAPGNGGESLEGPGSAEEAAFAARAYPATDISLRKSQASLAAFSSAALRGEAEAGPQAVRPAWQSVGPSRAVYPFEPLRNNTNYVPNRYVAGGRTTAVALNSVCKPGDCRMWITPAGGGVWRTQDALVGEPTWKYLGGPLGINAAGAITVDPNDRTGNTVYVGTGEANTCASGCVGGVGMYKSTDGGDTWSGPLGGDVLSGKGFGAIVVKPGTPRTLFAATTTALRGMSSACCTGVTRPVPDAAKWGLYKSTDGGASWRFIHNGSRDPAECTGSQTEFANNGICSPRGVRHLEVDPSDPDTLYASSYARGVWRSSDAGVTWTQVKASLNPLLATTRAAIAVNTLPNGNTRMYVHEGNAGDPTSRLFRSDGVRTGNPKWNDLTSDKPADPGFAFYNQCGGQCWYDLFVHSPAGSPDVVYTGGSYAYDEVGGISNGRAVVLSTDAGRTGTDLTMDGTDPRHPNGLHPDQHDLITRPGSPFEFWEVNDGGLMRSDGRFSDISAQCATRDLEGAELSRCRQLLSRVPARLDGQNKGLNTLQFVSLSVSPHDANLLQGGTQDNGTWESDGNRVTWRNTMIGDGGWSGFDAKRPDFRFHTFFDASPEVNFNNGKLSDWIWTADPIYGIPGTLFYTPVISDPRVSGTMFAGTGLGVHRTKTFGLGSRSLAEAQKVCNEWTGTFEETCGDWELLGPTPLTVVGWGSREGGAVSAVERTAADTSTAWAATSTGRLFISKNVAASPASAVRWTRLDAPSTPNRFVSSIHVDPQNSNRAWVSFSGYDQSTPGEPGHVFRVVVDPATGKATWTDLSHDLADLPITDLVRDDQTGDLYASSDFGILRLPAGTTSWRTAGRGLPNVEVAGLTVVPGKRILYAASHGLGAWRLDLGG